MAEHKPLCTWSRSEANRSGEIDFWRKSNKENHICARAIEESIHLNFNGMNLNADCAKHVIEAFGFERVNWVLANTIREKMYDGRFSASNKEWAKTFRIPKDESNCFFCVESHPAVLDGFIDQARKAWQDLGLFDISHCESEAEGEINYSGKVVVIDPHQLKDAYKTADDQLFLATGGFGCSPNSRGRKVFGEFLKDGEKTYYLSSSAAHGNQYAAQLLHSIETNRNWSATLGTLHLFYQLSQMIQKRIEEEAKHKTGTIDRKLKRIIDEKKQAHGLKQG